jgi:hypothetical protein
MATTMLASLVPTRDMTERPSASIAGERFNRSFLKRLYSRARLALCLPALCWKVFTFRSTDNCARVAPPPIELWFCPGSTSPLEKNCDGAKNFLANGTVTATSRSTGKLESCRRDACGVIRWPRELRPQRHDTAGVPYWAGAAAEIEQVRLQSLPPDHQPIMAAGKGTSAGSCGPDQSSSRPCRRRGHPALPLCSRNHVDDR